jgi:hypothetical protein
MLENRQEETNTQEKQVNTKNEVAWLNMPKRPHPGPGVLQYGGRSSATAMPRMALAVLP